MTAKQNNMFYFDSQLSRFCFCFCFCFLFCFVFWRKINIRLKRSIINNISETHKEKHTNSRTLPYKRQVENARHPFFNHARATHRLASRESFLKSVEPLPTSTSEIMRVATWERLQISHQFHHSHLSPSFTNGTQPLWRASSWSKAHVDRMKCLNRLKTGKGRCKVLLHKWDTWRKPRSKLWLWLYMSPIPRSIYSSVLCWSKYAQLKILQPIMILHKNVFSTDWTVLIEALKCFTESIRRR